MAAPLNDSTDSVTFASVCAHAVIGVLGPVCAGALATHRSAALDAQSESIPIPAPNLTDSAGDSTLQYRSDAFIPGTHAF